MPDLTVSLIVVAITGVLVAGLFIYLNMRKKQQSARLEQTATEFGWQMQPIRKPLSSGYLFHGKFPGASWSMESRADASGRESGPGSSEVSHTTRWWTDAVSLPGSGVIIGPRPAGAPDFNHPLLQLGMHALLGQDAAWASGLTPMEHGTRAFQARYITLAEKEVNLQRLLRPRWKTLSWPSRRRSSRSSN